MSRFDVSHNRKAQIVMCDRNDFINILPKNTIGAEIGVQYGGHAIKMFNIINPKELHLVDTWCEKGENGIYNYNKVKTLFENNDNVYVIRNTSVDQAKKYPDEYFDWVYIDALHQYEHISEDIRTWYPKVKKGGILCGHDYVTCEVKNFGVVKAVHEFLDEYNLKLTYTTNSHPNDREWGVIKL